jgi:sulfatase modifying factor 1
MQPAKKSSLANDPGLYPGYFPDSFPTWWASDWGEDEFGLWMALTYKGVRQAFRWIAPGAFLMGSPEDEPERYSNETQHQVTLTQGY